MLLQKKLIKKETLYIIGLLISSIGVGHGMQSTTDDISYDPNRKMIYRGKNLDNVNRPEMAPLPIRRTENMVEYELMLAQELTELTISRSIKGYSLPIAKATEILQESILKTFDRRELVDEPHIFPWHVHGHMEMDYGGGSIYIGTGTLIGENYAITAAHNLYDRRSGSIPQKITFFPGLMHKKIYAASSADRIIYHPSYMDPKNTNFKDVDIGIIRLKEPLGKKVGSLGVKTLSNSQLSEISEGKKVNITGYPGDYAGGTLMCTMEGPIKEWSQTRFFYDIDTTAGQSGSGVWVEEDGEHAVVGVHTYGDDEGKNLNSGTRINDDNGNLIKIWTSGTTN